MNKRRNILIICVLLAVCGLLFLINALQQPPAVGGTVVITVDGREYQRLQLQDHREITLTFEDGEFNTLCVDREGVEMIAASCRDQLCVHQGKVTAANAAQRALGNQIICLPHRVIVLLTDLPASETDGDLPDA